MQTSPIPSICAHLLNFYLINCSAACCCSHRISCWVLQRAWRLLEQSSSQPPAAQRRNSHLQFSFKQIHAVQRRNQFSSKSNNKQIIRFTEFKFMQSSFRNQNLYLPRWSPAQHPRTPCRQALRSLERTCVKFVFSSQVGIWKKWVFFWSSIHDLTCQHKSLSGYGKSPTVSLRQPTPPEHQELNQHYMIVLTRQKLKWIFFGTKRKSWRDVQWCSVGWPVSWCLDHCRRNLSWLSRSRSHPTPETRRVASVILCEMAEQVMNWKQWVGQMLFAESVRQEGS